MHIHISMQNNSKETSSRDADGEDSAMLKCALAGMIDLMPAIRWRCWRQTSTHTAASQPVCKNADVGLLGHNNRTVALRDPAATAGIITAWSIAWRGRRQPVC